MDRRWHHFRNGFPTQLRNYHAKPKSVSPVRRQSSDATMQSVAEKNAEAFHVHRQESAREFRKQDLHEMRISPVRREANQDPWQETSRNSRPARMVMTTAGQRRSLEKYASPRYCAEVTKDVALTAPEHEDPSPGAAHPWMFSSNSRTSLSRTTTKLQEADLEWNITSPLQKLELVQRSKADAAAISRQWSGVSAQSHSSFNSMVRTPRTARSYGTTTAEGQSASSHGGSPPSGSRLRDSPKQAVPRPLLGVERRSAGSGSVPEAPGRGAAAEAAAAAAAAIAGVPGAQSAPQTPSSQASSSRVLRRAGWR